MLSTTCPRTAAAIAAAGRRARFAAAFGRFPQRTIDRRYCGLPFSPGAGWLAVAVQLSRGVPSRLCWPFSGTPGGSFIPGTAHV